MKQLGAELKIAINLDDLGTDKEDKDRVLKGIKDGVKYYKDSSSVDELAKLYKENF